MSRNDSSNEAEISPEHAVDIAAGAVTTVVDEIVAAEFTEADLLDEVNDGVTTLKPTGKALKKKSEAEAQEAKKRSSQVKKKRNLNPLKFIIIFLGQVIAQMKKVHWITRKQTVVYTIAVLIFVVLCVGFVAGWDLFFAFLMDKVFVRNHTLG